MGLIGLISELEKKILSLTGLGRGETYRGTDRQIDGRREIHHCQIKLFMTFLSVTQSGQ